MRIFPWLQNKDVSKTHNDAKHVRLVTMQTKSKKHPRQSACKETKDESHLRKSVSELLILNFCMSR